MKRSPAFWIPAVVFGCIGVAFLALLLLLVADLLFGVLHDEVDMAQRVRKGITEDMAIQLAVLIQKEDKDASQRTIDALSSRKGEILSVAIRRRSGHVYIQTADHDRHWVPLKDGKPSITHVAVPIYAGKEIWGHVEVSFPRVAWTIRPRDDVATAQRVREAIAAHLAIQLAVLIQPEDSGALQRTIDAISGHGEVLSIGLRRNSGELYAQGGNHDRHWIQPKDGKSTTTHVALPIYTGKDIWGAVEVSFHPAPE